MVRVDASGVTTTGFIGYRELFEEQFRTVWGNDLSLEPFTPQAQLIGILGQIFTDAEDFYVDFAANLRLDTASGVFLENLASLMGIVRERARPSTISVTITGTAGTEMPVGMGIRSRAGNDLYRLSRSITLPSGGRTLARFQAERIGPLLYPGTEWTLVDAPSAVLGASGGVDFVGGAFAETDDILRARMRNQIGRSSTGSNSTLERRVGGVAGVSKVRVDSNNNPSNRYIGGIRVKPNSIIVAVLGGESDNIASEIARSKPVGIDTGTAPESNGLTPTGTYSADQGVYFLRASQIPLTVALTTQYRNDTFPSETGKADIQRALVAQVEGHSIGEGLSNNELLVAAFDVPGHIVQSIDVSRKSGNSDESVTSIGLTNNGAGYSSVPSVAITGGGTPTVTATATARMELDKGDIAATNGGSGYHASPTITITQTGGSEAKGEVILDRSSQTVDRVDVTSGGTGYTSGPAVRITGAGRGATAEAVVQGGVVTKVVITDRGFGYVNVPTVTIDPPPIGTGGTQAFATASLVDGYVDSITLTSGGTQYTNTAVCTVSGGGATIDAEVVASVDSNGVISDLHVVSGGAGYGYGPIAHILGNGTGAEATVTVDASGAVTKATITVGGREYSAAPTIEVVGGGGFGATVGSPTMSVSDVVVVRGGEDYDSVPTVTFSGGSPTTAAAATAVVGGIEDADMRFHEVLSLVEDDITVTLNQ